MAYKTFEDMKHDIPEGATHYHNETDDYLFCWFKIVGNKWFVFCPDEAPRWEKCNLEHHRSGIVQFLQTETPPEREALDMIDATSKQVESLANDSELPNSSEWDGGLPPVGVECEKIFDGKPKVITPLYYDDNKNGMVMFYYCKSGAYISRKYDWCLVENCIFRKLETLQQREDRERLEAAFEVYLAFWSASKSTIITMNMSEFKECSDLNYWLAVVDKTGYRKAAHLKECE